MKNAAKLCVLLLTAALCSAALFSCNYFYFGETSADRVTSVVTESEASQEESIIYGQKYLNEHYPKEFSLKYQIKSVDPIRPKTDFESVYSYTRTENGIYFDNNGEEMLFVKTEGGYFLCEKDENGVFVRDETEVYGESFAASACFEVLKAVTVHTDLAVGAEDMGRSSVAARDCEQFSLNNGEVMVTYSVDKKTGICLYYSEVSFGEEPAVYEIKCLEFQDKNIVLPMENN